MKPMCYKKKKKKKKVEERVDCINEVKEMHRQEGTCGGRG
jgi:hypothetical protein